MAAIIYFWLKFKIYFKELIIFEKINCATLWLILLVQSYHFLIMIYYLHGRSQSLNWPIQDIPQNLDDDVIIMMLTLLPWRYWGLLHRCNFTWVIFKNSKVNIFIHWRVLRVSNCASSNKRVTFGCLMDMSVD